MISFSTWLIRFFCFKEREGPNQKRSSQCRASVGHCVDVFLALLGVLGPRLQGGAASSRLAEWGLFPGVVGLPLGKPLEILTLISKEVSKSQDCSFYQNHQSGWDLSVLCYQPTGQTNRANKNECLAGNQWLMPTILCLGGYDGKDHGSRPTQANSSQDPPLWNNQSKMDWRCGSSAKPWVQTPFPLKERKKTNSLVPKWRV
jgi:hypothetical protein